MKKFNLKLITPLILTLILQGCMPDSLTKFKKDTPKKVAVAGTTTTAPVVDDSGNPISFDSPTKFYYVSETDPTSYLTVGTVASIKPVMDGSLADPTVSAKFFESCALAGSLPTGISLNTETCEIGGTPTMVSPSTGVPSAVTITMNYKDSDGVSDSISTTVNLSSLKKLTTLKYSQSDKVILSATATSSGKFSDISPLFSATSTPYLNATPYARANTIVDSNGVIGVAKLIDSSRGKIGINKLVAIKVDDTAGFVANCLVSASVAAGGGSGKIFKVDSSTKTLYIENISSNNKYFAPASAANDITQTATLIDTTPDPDIPACAVAADEISSVTDSYIFESTSLDNDSQYYSDEYTMSAVTNVYEVDSPIKNLKPITSDEIGSTFNAITYTISPALPSGLTLSSTSGEISGTFTDALDSTLFKITATNPISSTSKQIYLSAIAAPQDLTYTTNQLIAVASNASFNEGETIFQPITPPLTESVSGQILRRYGTTYMAIATKNGQFLKDASLDSGNAYYAQKTTITADPISFNVAVIVSASINAAVGDYVSSNTNALGRVVAIDGFTLFIQYLNTSATPKLFKQNDKINKGATYSATGAQDIGQVEANNMKLTYEKDVSSIKAGDELTADDTTDLPGYGELSGYIHKITTVDNTFPTLDTNDLYVSDISRKSTQTNYFRIGQEFDDNEQGLAEEGVFSAVAHDNFFVVDRGASAEIKANLLVGNGIIYSVSPTLPSGLTINSTTGVISGTPAVATPRTTYTVSAKNFIDESTFVFELESRDHFEITQNLGASSILFHKYGDSRESRKCRINAIDIKNFAADSTSVNSGALDIRCFLEAEEEDLYFNKLKFISSVGPGVCEYIQIYPYSFFQYEPIKTAGVYAYHTGGCAAAPTAAPTSEDFCAGNYTNSDGPNCDEGKVTVTTHTWELNPAETCVDTQTTADLACGGKKSNCLKGPVRDLLSDGEIQAGHRSKIYSSANGQSITSTFPSPYDNLDLTNLRVANGTIKNQCKSSNADADTWTTKVFALNNPLGGGANPFYVINCLDAAKDVKARIRIVVRDWNKTFKVKDSIDYDIPGGGAGTALMNNSSALFGKSNNDYADWDDDYTNLGSCSNATFTTEYNCISNGGVWTSGGANYTGGCGVVPGGAGARDYAFPEGNI